MRLVDLVLHHVQLAKFHKMVNGESLVEMALLSIKNSGFHLSRVEEGLRGKDGGWYGVMVPK